MDNELNWQCTISSCEKELEDIQGLLENLSTDITEKMKEKENTLKSVKNVKEGRQLSNSSQLNTILTCSNAEFEAQTDQMSVTDLELAQVFLQTELRMLQGYLKQVGTADNDENINDKISIIQDRVYRCITKQGQTINDSFVRRSSVQFLDECDTAPVKPQQFIETRSVSRSEIEDMNTDEMEVLLRFNSINFPENSSREILLELINNNLPLTDEWEPPDVDAMHWNNAVDLSSTTESLPLPAAEMANFKGPTTPIFLHLTDDDLIPQDNNQQLVEWDPTELLKELYSKITTDSKMLKKQVIVKNKKVNCMQGYLDKLPVNQVKVKAFKSWKKRFFQVAHGKLFYYEDHKAETPFGNIDILGSEIEAGENRTINITARLKFAKSKELTGNKLVLRCNSDSELADWLAVLKATATIKPVMGSLKCDDGMNKKIEAVVIIDLGASTVRAGMSTAGCPSVAFPSTFAVKQMETKGRRFTTSGLPDPHLCKCGFEAFIPANRRDAKLVYPLQPSIKVDKYSIKVHYIPGLLEKAFHLLELDATDKTVILSVPRYLNDKDKEYILDYMFGQMNVKAVYMQHQALLALHSYGATTGLIVDIGDHLDVLPVIEGVVVEKGAISLPYAGQQITDYLGKLLTETGYRFFSDIESFIVRFVKEEVAEASVDFQKDMTSSPHPVDVNIAWFNLPGNRKQIKVGNSKYRCVEGLFNPGLWGKDDVPLHHMIERSIKACDIDNRRELCKSIYLSGGSSVIKGLGDRLQQELRHCLPEASNVQVIASASRLNAAFKGASVMVTLTNFKDSLITRDEWEADGATLLSKWHA